MLAGIAAALRPGGVYLCVDTSASSKLAENLDHPLGPFLYTVSCMHCMTVSLADGGMGLGTMWGEQTARKMLGEAGFTSVEADAVDGDIVNAYIIATKAERHPDWASSGVRASHSIPDVRHVEDVVVVLFWVGADF